VGKDVKQLDRVQRNEHRAELHPASLRTADLDIIPAMARGEDRREFKRPGETDWRINPRSYEFIGAV